MSKNIKSVILACLLLTSCAPGLPYSVVYGEDHPVKNDCNLPSDDTYTAIADGILASQNQTILSEDAKKMLKSFVIECKFFDQPEHDRAWLETQRANLNYNYYHYGDQMALPFMKELDHLYFTYKQK